MRTSARRADGTHQRLPGPPFGRTTASDAREAGTTWPGFLLAGMGTELPRLARCSRTE
jgi:hypothetical protein